MKNDLGNRMKEQYENRTRYSLPRRTYTIIRLDGARFHTYTRGLKKPFDKDLFEDIDKSIIAMFPEVQGSVFAYTQSDEISVLLTDFAMPQTDAWFDGNLQKICSVSTSILTAQFNRFRLQRFVEKHSLNLLRDDAPIAYFDARVFTIPDRIEVMNYFLWRNNDCVRNSVSMVAQSLYSQKELMGKSSAEQQEMIHDKGVSWVNDFSASEKNGRLIVKEEYVVDYKPTYASFDFTKGNSSVAGVGTIRTHWVSKGAWKFTEDKEKLLAMIPNYE
jgi:tRNA(His) 5'-end guanylyltransferase